MINKENLEQIDISGMHKVYNDWPKIARDTYESKIQSIDFRDIDHVVFIGMGGSGAIGDMFSTILSKNNIHISLVKGYLLPKTITKNTLVVATSVSGNTVETLTAFKSAKNFGCKLIGISSGGFIEKYCNENRIFYKKIEMIHSPRASFIKFIYSLLAVLSSILPIHQNDIVDSINNLESIQKEISSENLSKSNPSLQLASWITGIPLIYYPYGLQSAAIRFKSSLQENSKIHVITEDIIEACHNGIVAWEKPSQVQPILIQGKDDYVKTKERWNIIKEYFSKNSIDFKEVHSINGHILSKILVLSYILDYTSIYHAILNKTDPSPTKSIDFIKERL
ncbi:MAG: SIS domain-containing protein [Nitrosopumilus sp.]|nr:SIS domain-containing protein [Nitrosopumilus sp.]